MVEAKTLDRPRATCLPGHAGILGARGSSPVDTTDPLPGRQPGGYLRCRSLGPPGERRRLTIMRVTGDRTGKPQLRT